MHVGIVQHDAAEGLCQEVVLCPVNFYLPPDSFGGRDLSHLFGALKPTPVVGIGIIQEKGSIELCLSLPAHDAYLISAFWCGSIALKLLVPDAVIS